MTRIANASILGYAAFALTLWMNSMIAAEWFDVPATRLALLLAVVLGGCVMAIAGILQALRGHTLDATVFLGFAAYWWVAELATRAPGNGSAIAASGFLGWYYFVWALFAFCLWLAECRDGVARMLFTLGLCVTLLAFALAGWTHVMALTVLGGYLGLVTAIVGIYIAAAEAINEIHGHTVLPLGEVGSGRPEVPPPH